MKVQASAAGTGSGTIGSGIGGCNTEPAQIELIWLKIAAILFKILHLQ